MTAAVVAAVIFFAARDASAAAGCGRPRRHRSGSRAAHGCAAPTTFTRTRSDGAADKAAIAAAAARAPA